MSPSSTSLCPLMALMSWFSHHLLHLRLLHRHLQRHHLWLPCHCVQRNHCSTICNNHPAVWSCAIWSCLAWSCPIWSLLIWSYLVYFCAPATCQAVHEPRVTSTPAVLPSPSKQWVSGPGPFSITVLLISGSAPRTAFGL